MSLRFHRLPAFTPIRLSGNSVVSVLLVLTTLFLIFGLATGIALQNIEGRLDSEAGQRAAAGTFLVFALANRILLMAALWVAAFVAQGLRWSRRIRWAEFGLTGCGVKWLAAAAILGPALVVVKFALVAIAALFFEPSDTDAWLKLAVKEAAQDPIILAGAVLAICVVTPLLEEIVFRGVIFSWLRGRFLFWPSALISASAFALAHVTRLPELFVIHILSGLVEAWLYERSGSLWPAIICHAGINASVIFGGLLLFNP